jgi:hypothetical protein
MKILNGKARKETQIGYYKVLMVIEGVWEQGAEENIRT